MRDTLTYMADLDKSIDMIELLLFGPQYSLGYIQDPELHVADESKCLKSTVCLT